MSRRSGDRYYLDVWNPSQISSVEGGVVTRPGKLEIDMPQGDADSYVASESRDSLSPSA